MIGILSSGLGGLLVARELEKRQSSVGIYYWGDTAGGLWGSRSKELVRERVARGMKFLQERGVTSIILASGDASVALRMNVGAGFTSAHDGENASPAPTERIELIDYWDAQVKAMESVSKTKRIGVIGSRLVIDNSEELGFEKKGFTVYKKAIPALAPLIIEGEEKRGEMRRMIRAHLQWFKSQNIDALILGSMYYVRVFDDIQAKMGKRTVVINPVQALIESLPQQGEMGKGEQKFYLTDVMPRDINVGKEWLGRTVALEGI